MSYNDGINEVKPTLSYQIRDIYCGILKDECSSRLSIIGVNRIGDILVYTQHPHYPKTFIRVNVNMVTRFSSLATIPPPSLSEYNNKMIYPFSNIFNRGGVYINTPNPCFVLCTRDTIHVLSMANIESNTSNVTPIIGFAELNIHECRNGYLYLNNDNLYFCEPSDSLVIIGNSNVSVEKHELDSTVHLIDYIGECIYIIILLFCYFVIKLFKMK